MQPLHINEEYCTRVVGAKSRCEKCLKICPHDAIRINKKSIEILDSCNACGLCASVCNNDVFALKNFTEIEIIRWIGDNVRKDKMDIFCERYPSANGECLLVPCIYSLTENILLYPFTANIKSIHLNLPECSLCVNRKGENNLAQKINLTEKLLKFMGIEGSIETIKNEFSPVEKSKNQFYSRRAFFKQITAISPIKIKDNRNEKENSKRKLLVEILKKSNHLDATVRADQESTPFCNIQIDSNCIGCIVCEKLCPFDAIRRVEGGKSIKIQFSHQRCTNCKLCVDSCFFSSINVNPEVALVKILDDNFSDIASVTCRI